jgi:hypothetical protein
VLITRLLVLYLYMMKGFIVLSGFLALMSPAFASAASYAYVNSSGNVSMVQADTATLAMRNAPNISVHSGVMLLSSLTDSLIGDQVAGM